MRTYGIDLGTTYSCVAYMDESGRPVIAQNLLGEDTTPSVVYFENTDNVVVGVEAKKSAVLESDRVVSLIKRQMGKDFEKEIDGVTHTPQSISGLILRHLAKATADLTHDEVKDVVITVPAYFGVAERQATLQAGKIAELNVLSLVPEPVAAALHYEAIAGEANSTILVYDLGGGTFDTTVIQIDGADINVVCTDGDHKLGGADWDTRIADYLLETFLAENPDSPAAESEDFLQDLVLAAESLKKGLSSAVSRRHNMRFDGAVAKVELTREKFEELTADLLERTFEITERTLEVAREQGITTFDEVLLVGGSSKMPAVEAGLRSARFGFSPKLHDPDLAVAKGAARFALIESVKIRVPDGGSGAESEEAIVEVADQLGLEPEKVRQLAGKRVTSVVPRAFGVKVLESDDGDDPVFQVAHVLRANSPLPASPPAERFFTAYPNQTSVVIEIWEQAGSTESPHLGDNTRIGEGEITDLPPLPQSSPLDITFTMDELGTLRVHAVEQRTGKDLVIELRIDGLSAEQVVEARNAVARYSLSE